MRQRQPRKLLRSLLALMLLYTSLLALTSMLGCTPLPGGPMSEAPTSIPIVSEPTAQPTTTPTVVSAASTVAPTVPPKATPSPMAPSDAKEWLVYAGLGPNAVDDPLKTMGLALTEGYAVLYTDSSRAETSLEAMMTAHPGFEGEAYTIGSYDIYVKLRADLAQDEPQGDLYLVADAPRTLSLLNEGLLWNYVPDDLVAVLPMDMREPLLTHHWTMLGLVRNDVVTRTREVDSWWDLTRPEWRGRVALPNPIYNERMLDLLITAAQHPDAWATAYEAEFGLPLALESACPNAGFQWIKNLLANEPRLLAGDAEVAAMVGGLESTEEWLGICGTEQLPKSARGDLNLEWLVQAEPFAGLRWRTYVGIIDQCGRPNAAKFTLRWLMGDHATEDEEGDLQGFEMWNRPGFYSSRTDLPDAGGSISREELEPRLWELEITDWATARELMLDFVRTHIARPTEIR